MGTSKFESRAIELGEIVMKKTTPQAARAYLGWVAWLGTSYYNPNQRVLETALDSAVLDMENAALPIAETIKNYEFFGHVASMYGLDSKAGQYRDKLSTLR
ncbi:MAG: hypothetical protein AABX33_06525 [Nanoarchaeota archaeon]